MPKRAKWKDNFVKVEDNTPSEPQKRPGTCFNCGYGSFTLEIGKGSLKGHLLRRCKSCKTIIDLDE